MENSIKMALKKAFATKLTENGDETYSSTCNNLLDLFGMAMTYQEQLKRGDYSELPVIGDSNISKLLAMYIRDPRFGQGFKKLGRHYAKYVGLTNDEIVKSGSYKDFIEDMESDEDFKIMFEIMKSNRDYNSSNYLNAEKNFTKKYSETIEWYWSKVINGDGLAKKFAPRFHKSGKKGYRTYSKSQLLAKLWCRILDVNHITYSKCIKVKTIESQFSHATKANGELQEIEFSKIPSVASKKLVKRFKKTYEGEDSWRDISENYNNYIEAVKSALETGDKSVKMNVGAINIVDIYMEARKSDGAQIDPKAQTYINEKAKELKDQECSWIPCTDTSGSMGSPLSNGIRCIDIALAISYFFAKTSKYAPNMDIVFDSNTRVIEFDPNRRGSRYDEVFGDPKSNFTKEINSITTGACGSTNFAKVLQTLRKLDPEKLPEWVIIVSDMEFNMGSSTEIARWRADGIPTKFIWWTCNNRQTTTPVTVDDYGNLIISGYNPTIVDALTSGDFNPENYSAEAFMMKALSKYAKRAGVEYLLN